MCLFLKNGFQVIHRSDRSYNNSKSMSYIEAEEWDPMNCDCIDQFFDSPFLNPQFDSLPDAIQEGDLFNLNIQPPCTSAPKSRKVKAEKVRKIRTSRNSQKVYHNILKRWLFQNHFEQLANKYNKYFNQRIYFILVLQEIVKSIDGALFVQSYEQLVGCVRKKKESEIQIIKTEVELCEQIQHLNRLIQEINFSVGACREFVEGNVLNAIIIVFKRSQKKITKMKEFKEAIKIFQNEAGYAPDNL